MRSDAQSPDKAKLIDRIAADVSTDVYAAVVKLYEEAEHAGLIFGNGHHMAQIIAESARQLLLNRVHGKVPPWRQNKVGDTSSEDA